MTKFLSLYTCTAPYFRLFHTSNQNISLFIGLGSRSWVVLAPWSRSPLKKKQGAGAAWKKKSGAGAAKKLASSSAKKQLSYLLYISPNLTYSQEPEPVCLAPWSRSRSKKIPGAGAAWEKIRSRSRLKKVRSQSRSRLNLACSPPLLIYIIKT